MNIAGGLVLFLKARMKDEGSTMKADARTKRHGDAERIRAPLPNLTVGSTFLRRLKETDGSKHHFSLAFLAILAA
jgi:hypothetical protein